MQHFYRHKNFIAGLLFASVIALFIAIPVIENTSASITDDWITVAMSLLFSWLIVIAIKVGIDANRNHK